MIKTTKDGRTIRKGKDYTKFRWGVYTEQMGRCAKCGAMTDFYFDPMNDRSFHVHHKNGRGMGGSKRDDTFPACMGLCGACHRKEHNQ